MDQLDLLIELRNEVCFSLIEAKEGEYKELLEYLQNIETEIEILNNKKEIENAKSKI